MPHIGPWDYAAPVYARVLLYTYMHRLLWKNHRGADPETVARERYQHIDLGKTTGKTTAVVKFCEDHDGCIVVCRTVDLAGRIRQRFPGVRAFGVDEMTRFKPDKFADSDPMLIFDDVCTHDTVALVARFKPERFVHVGIS